MLAYLAFLLWMGDCRRVHQQICDWLLLPAYDPYCVRLESHYDIEDLF